MRQSRSSVCWFPVGLAFMWGITARPCSLSAKAADEDHIPRNLLYNIVTVKAQSRVPAPRRSTTFWSITPAFFIITWRSNQQKNVLLISGPLTSPNLLWFILYCKRQNYDIHLFTHLSGCLGVVRIPRLFPPGTLHRLTIDIRIVDSHDGMGSGLLGRESAIIDPVNIDINLLSPLGTHGTLNMI
jgi:hypothetical protein